jgi:hypothetical protein
MNMFNSHLFVLALSASLLVASIAVAALLLAARVAGFI